MGITNSMALVGGLRKAHKRAVQVARTAAIDPIEPIVVYPNGTGVELAVGDLCRLALGDRLEGAIDGAVTAIGPIQHVTVNGDPHRRVLVEDHGLYDGRPTADVGTHDASGVEVGPVHRRGVAAVAHVERDPAGRPPDL